MCIRDSQYLIKDAIADENVLGFLVEYYHGNEEVERAMPTAWRR